MKIVVIYGGLQKKFNEIFEGPSFKVQSERFAAYFSALV